MFLRLNGTTSISSIEQRCAASRLASPRYGRLWTQLEVDRLHEMREMGKTYLQISQGLGRTEKSVCHAAERFGLVQKKWRRHHAKA